MIDRLEEALSGRTLPVVVVFLTAIIGLVVWVPTPVGAMHDDGVYAILGRALANGDGYRFVGIAGEPPGARFPPVYPLVLAAAWAIGGGIEAMTLIATGLNLVFTIAGAALCAQYFRSRLGLASVEALVGTLLAWLVAAVWISTFVPLSEPLFVLLLICSLWVASVVEGGTTGVAPLLGLVVALALLTLTRTAGIAIVAGVVAGLCVRRRPGAALVTALGVAVAIGPWVVWTRRATASLPSEYRDFFASYSGWLADRILTDPGRFVVEIPGAVREVTTLIADMLLPGMPDGVQLWVGPPLILLALIGLARIGRVSPSAALSILLYLIVLVLWPVRTMRLTVPFAPFAFAGLVVAGAWIVRHAPRLDPATRRGAAAVVTVGALAISMTSLVGGAAADPLRVRLALMGDALRAIEEHVPPEGVVGAPELWPAIPLYTDRIGIPSARFQPGSAVRQGLPEEQYRVWIETGLEYLITEGSGSIHGAALERLDRVCPGQATRLTSAGGDGPALVRLDWDAECRERLGGD